MMDQAHVAEHYTAYLEGTLPEETRQQVEAHLRACPPCAEELAQLRGLVAELHALPTVAAPVDLTDVVRARRAARRPVRAGWPGRFALAGVLGLVLMMAAVGVVVLRHPTARQVARVDSPAPLTAPAPDLAAPAAGSKEKADRSRVRVPTPAAEPDEKVAISDQTTDPFAGGAEAAPAKPFAAAPKNLGASAKTEGAREAPVANERPVMTKAVNDVPATTGTTGAEPAETASRAMADNMTNVASVPPAAGNGGGEPPPATTMMRTQGTDAAVPKVEPDQVKAGPSRVAPSPTPVVGRVETLTGVVASRPAPEAISYGRMKLSDFTRRVSTAVVNVTADAESRRLVMRHVEPGWQKAETLDLPDDGATTELLVPLNRDGTVVELVLLDRDDVALQNVYLAMYANVRPRARVTLELKRQPMYGVIRQLAVAAGICVLFPPDLAGTRNVSLAVRNTPPLDALAQVVGDYGYRLTTVGNLVRVEKQ